MQITNPISQKIWKDRYSKNGETLEGNLKRVAGFCSNSEWEYETFLEVMQKGHFFPAGRTMSNSGIGRSLTLNNCFTLNFVEDSMVDIFDKVKMAALTHQKGGGTGFDFSMLRPSGTPTSNDAIASGPISFINVFDAQTATILQGNRRGANMGVLSVYHPDILEFINAKSYDEGKLVHFNLSVMVDDSFIEAVMNDSEIHLHYPVYNPDGSLLKDESKWTHSKKVKAKDIWDAIIRKAYDNGEPGVLFYDNMNKDNNTWYTEKIVNTNPCGEYLSGVVTLDGKVTPYKGACNLGSIHLQNLIKYPFTENAKLDDVALKEAVTAAVRFLDNIIDKNNYPLKDYEDYQKSFRTIGLGVTGLADALAMLGYTYGSKDSIYTVDQIMHRIVTWAYKASIQLAKEKGSFPLLNREKFIESNFIKKHIEKDSAWKDIAGLILKHGIRNARIMSVAPTGTTTLTYGNNCSSGIEPIFALSYNRKIKMGGQDDSDIREVTMRDYAYEKWLQTKEGNIVPKSVFVTAQELTVQDHLAVLKTVAFHVDQSVSKTINVPTSYSFEETKNVFLEAWESGIKGCTIFRPNELRQGILTTSDSTPKDTLDRGEWGNLAPDTEYHRRKIYIGCGKINLFIGYSRSQNKIQDLYVVRSGQGGCERNLQGMVIAMSGMLRLGGNLSHIEKAFEGIGVCPSFVSQRAKGNKLSKGASCGTAILNEIKKFMDDTEKEEPIEKSVPEPLTKTTESSNEKDDELFTCPECGEKSLKFEGGCNVCMSCGFSKCS